MPQSTPAQTVDAKTPIYTPADPERTAAQAPITQPYLVGMGARMEPRLGQFAYGFDVW